MLAYDMFSGILFAFSFFGGTIVSVMILLPVIEWVLDKVEG